MAAYTFTVPGEPAGKGRPRFNTRTGHAYTPEKTRSYEALVKWCYHGPVYSGAVKMDITAYMQIPQKITKARLAAINSGETPTKRPDADNIMKAIADALNGIAYQDDAQITDVTMRKRWSVEPRVEVTIDNA